MCKCERHADLTHVASEAQFSEAFQSQSEGAFVALTLSITIFRYRLKGSKDVFGTIFELVKHYMKELRDDLGLQLKMPGNYLRTYVGSGYSTEKQSTGAGEGSAAPTAKYSRGSLEAKERAAMAELDDLDDSDGEMDGFGALTQIAEDDSAAVYDMASGDTGAADAAGIAGAGTASAAAAPDYDLASGDAAVRAESGNTLPADYDLASGDAGVLLDRCPTVWLGCEIRSCRSETRRVWVV